MKSTRPFFGLLLGITTTSAPLSGIAGEVPIPYSPIMACKVSTTYPVNPSTPGARIATDAIIEGTSVWTSATVIPLRPIAGRPTWDRELLNTCLGSLYSGAGTPEMLSQLPIRTQLSGTAVIPLKITDPSRNLALLATVHSVSPNPLEEEEDVGEDRNRCRYRVQFLSATPATGRRPARVVELSVNRNLQFATPPATAEEALGICATTAAEAAIHPEESARDLPRVRSAHFNAVFFELILNERTFSGRIEVGKLPSAFQRLQNR